MCEEYEYLMPDYFPQFHCKMGACRAACCEGWPISVSLSDYFKLLSVDCSAELRRRLDCALHISENPSPEGYAHILPRYDGQCPLRLEDGRCGLQAELGEEMLAAVCRLYPRGVRTGETKECSCANSCEAVIELLLEHRSPLRFAPLRADFGVPEAPPRKFHFENAGREQEIRLWLIAHVQDRSIGLPRRLMLLGDAILAMSEAFARRDHARVERLLSGAETLHRPEEIETDPSHLRFGMRVAGGMLRIMDERSESIRAYGEAALGYFGGENGEYERYCSARERFEALFPEWETWFENMLVNHMFFAQFPFQDRPVELLDEFIALCAVYILLRFLCVGSAALRAEREHIVDVAAAAFRLIDHTDFDRYAAPILKDLGCDDRQHMLCLLSL